MAPSSRFAMSLKPNVAYLLLNFSALWKKQTTLPSFAYAGIPYRVFGKSAGALAVTIAWSLSAIKRSAFCIEATCASSSPSPAALLSFERASAFASLARSFIAAFSSSVIALDFPPLAVEFFAGGSFLVGLIEPPLQLVAAGVFDQPAIGRQHAFSLGGVVFRARIWFSIHR